MIDWRRAGDRLVSTVIFVVTLAICISSLEFAFRAYRQVPLFARTNWREGHFTSSPVRFDPVLGWANKPDISLGPIHTIAYGIRPNGPGDTKIRKGGILVVGDSFAAGSQVEDNESWPAQVESIVGQPTLNAGVGGYGIDQMVLRAEQLMPVIHPTTLILGTQREAIVKVHFSSWGRPKPYFRVSDGALALQPMAASADWGEHDEFHIKFALGYSYLLDQLLGAYAPRFWYTDSNDRFKEVDLDDVDVTCRLLKRLKADGIEQGARVLFVLQYGGATIAAGDTRPPDAEPTLQCARDLGIPTVDEFDTLRAIARQSAAEFRTYYNMGPDNRSFGHMSAKGNRLIAELVAEALKQPPAEVTNATTVRGSAEEPESSADGRNLLLLPDEDLPVSPGGIASFKATQPRDGGPTSYELAAAGGDSVHYVALPTQAALPAGTYTFSALVRPSHETRVRLQLLDESSAGSIADFDLVQDGVKLASLGLGRRQDATIATDADGWSRVALSVSLPSAGAHALIGLLDGRGVAKFIPNGESVVFQAAKVERGRPKTLAASAAAR